MVIRRKRAARRSLEGRKRGSEIPKMSKKKWSRRRNRGRKMMRSIRRAQKYNQIGLQEEESSKKKFRRKEETIERIT